MDIEDVRGPYSRLSFSTIGRLGQVGVTAKMGEKSGIIGVTLPPNGHIKDIEACGIAGLINIDGESMELKSEEYLNLMETYLREAYLPSEELNLLRKLRMEE